MVGTSRLGFNGTRERLTQSHQYFGTILNRIYLSETYVKSPEMVAANFQHLELAQFNIIEPQVHIDCMTSFHIDGNQETGCTCLNML